MLLVPFSIYSLRRGQRVINAKRIGIVIKLTQSTGLIYSWYDSLTQFDTQVRAILGIFNLL
jgi:hypothetical protein